MTATVREMVDALDTYIEGANGLGITCIKGFPDFRRPSITLPVAALFYAGSNGRPDAGRRVGSSSKAMTLTLAVYASDEVNLFALAEKLHSMRARHVTVTANSDTIRIYLGEDEREPPDDEAVKELRHLITCPVVMIYE